MCGNALREHFPYAGLFRAVGDPGETGIGHLEGGEGAHAVATVHCQNAIAPDRAEDGAAVLWALQGHGGAGGKAGAVEGFGLWFEDLHLVFTGGEHQRPVGILLLGVGSESEEGRCEGPCQMAEGGGCADHGTKDL